MADQEDSGPANEYIQRQIQLFSSLPLQPTQESFNGNEFPQANISRVHAAEVSQNCEVILAAQRKILDSTMKEILSSTRAQVLRDSNQKKLLIDVLKQKFPVIHGDFLESTTSWFSPLACFLISYLAEIGMTDSLLATGDSRLLSLFDYTIHEDRNRQTRPRFTLPSFLEPAWQQYIDIIKKNYEAEVSEFECQVCFNTLHISNGVYCVNLHEDQFVHDFDGITRSDNHRVCDDCLREMAKAATEDGAIANGGVGLKCVDPNCPGVILYAHVSPRLLDDDVRKRLHNRLQQVALSFLKGLESCKQCQFTMQIEVSKKEMPSFQCPRCNAQFCRTCNIDWKDHVNGSGHAKKCEDVMSPTDFKRIRLEEQLSEVVMRQCQCGKIFVKDGGCNMMHCSCGITTCYICKQVVQGSNHMWQGQQCKTGDNYQVVDRIRLDNVIQEASRDEALRSIANRLQ